MPEMKDSGIEWIGLIPSDWSVEKGKYHFAYKKIIPGVQSSKYERLSLTLKGVIPRAKDDADGLQPKDFNTYQLLRENELVFKLIDLQNVSTSRVGLSHDIDLVSPAYIIIHENGDIVPEFAEKFYLMMWHREIFNALGDNGVRSSLNAGDLLNVPLCFPNKNKQKLIASFLEEKCGEIDSLLIDVQSEIDILEEYKRSIINEAVTKGLNSDVKMIQSGVQWIDEIPEHWSIVPSKYLFRNSEERKREQDTLLTASQAYGIITQTDYMNITGMKIVLANQGVEKWKHVEPNDFIISLRSFQGGLEMSEITGCITWHYVVLKANIEVYHRFYKWLFKSTKYINALQGTCNFIRDGQDLRYSNFSQVPLFVLPFDEQKKIADYLDSKVADIDFIIETKREQLSTLEEYKKSVIYEYVTGKKEVPLS